VRVRHKDEMHKGSCLCVLDTKMRCTRALACACPLLTRRMRLVHCSHVCKTQRAQLRDQQLCGAMTHSRECSRFPANITFAMRATAICLHEHARQCTRTYASLYFSRVTRVCATPVTEFHLLMHVPFSAARDTITIRHNADLHAWARPQLSVRICMALLDCLSSSRRADRAAQVVAHCMYQLPSPAPVECVQQTAFLRVCAHEFMLYGCVRIRNHGRVLQVCVFALVHACWNHVHHAQS
jgi:hypothetical protein